MKSSEEKSSKTWKQLFNGTCGSSFSTVHVEAVFDGTNCFHTREISSKSVLLVRTQHARAPQCTGVHAPVLQSA